MKDIKIGNQIWSSENLALTVDRNGNELVLGRDYFYPNNDKNNVEEYGLLYTWEAAMKVVPKGWHLPSEEEWDELIKCVGCDAKVLAANTGWKASITPCAVGYNQITNNATGFNARPAGYHNSIGFCNFGNFTSFWSSTESSSSAVWGMDLYFGSTSVCQNYNDKNYGFSVRCIKDTNNIDSSDTNNIGSLIININIKNLTLNLK